MGIQLQTMGGPTNFTIAKTRSLENRGRGRSLRDTHSPGWSSFLRNPTFTPYNRLLRRQITASMTDQGKF